jgi:hypothetical protein
MATTPANPSRRSLLKKGIFGGLLLVLGGGTGLFLFPGREVASTPPALLSLSPRAFQVLVAFAGRVIPTGGDAVAVAQAVDRTLSYSCGETRADIDKLLGLFENALPGLLLDGRAMPFTRLSPEGQDSVLESWRSSHLQLRRTGFQALRKLCLSSYWVQETGWKAIGYDPPTGLNASAWDDSKMGTPEWIAAQNAAAAAASDKDGAP